MRESTRVRVGAIAVFLFVGLVASISSFVATDEFLTLEFFAFLFGNLIAPTIVVGFMLLFPRAFTRTELRRRRPERGAKSGATLIVTSIVLGLLLVWASAYVLGM
ncbi:MAG: hypothetical protein M3Q60_08640 [Actinomycetota bacterium]|nr:hypothetical protein [Actinomycetota bacterium]